MEEFNCCPKFDPKPWDNVTFMWQDKHFIKGVVPTIMYMPIGFGKVMTKLQSLASEHGSEIPDYLCLSKHESKWKMELLLAVEREIPNALNVTLGGKYYSKVFEGSFKETGRWMEEFEMMIHENNLHYDELYMWYTTCPKCSKKYGKNYVVIIARIG